MVFQFTVFKQLLKENEQSSSTEQQKGWTDNLGETAEQLKDKASEMLGKAGNKAEQLWEATEDKAGELVDKLKSGELADEAKEKLKEVADGAKSLWNKVVDKFDGDDTNKEKTE